MAHEISRREALIHPLEHASIHLGHIHMTVDLLTERPVKFTKMHGAGNDFLVVESAGEERDWATISVAMCERNLGVGADGLMLVLPSTKADFRMRLFNSDGSEAEVSGNGVRCLVKYAVERGIASGERRPGDDRGGT